MKFENICLKTKNDQYQMKVGDMLVEIKYSTNNKKIEEYMLNILRQKSKMGWYIILGTLHYKRREV